MNFTVTLDDSGAGRENEDLLFGMAMRWVGARAGIESGHSRPPVVRCSNQDCTPRVLECCECCGRDDGALEFLSGRRGVDNEVGGFRAT